MDIFKSVGNFFRGAFGGDSDEEKKRKAAAAAQAKAQAAKAPKPQPVKVPDAFGTPKPVAAKPPVTKPQPVVPATQPVAPRVNAVPVPAVPNAPLLKTPQPVQATKPVNNDITTKVAPQKTLVDFNNADLGKQRQMRDQIEKTTQAPVVTKEDLDRVTHAKQTLDLLDKEGKKKAGNFGTFLEDAGKSIKEGFTKPTQVLGEGLQAAVHGNDDNAAESKAISDGVQSTMAAYKAGHLSVKDYQDTMKQYQDRQQVLNYKLNKTIETTDPLKQAGAFVETASNLPVGLGAKAAVQEGANLVKKPAESLIRKLVTSALETGVPAGAGSAASAYRENGSKTNPVDAIVQGATGLATGAALGTGGTLLGKAAGQVAKRVRGDITEPTSDAAAGFTTTRGALDLKDDVAKAVEDANPELTAQATNESGTALQRKQAQDELDRITNEQRQKQATQDQNQTSAYDHVQAQKQIAADEEQSLNGYLHEHPDLSDAQRQAAVDEAKQRAIDKINKLNASREAALGANDPKPDAVADQAKDIADTQAEQQATAANTPADPTASTGPAEPTQTAPQAADPEATANDAYASQYNSTSDFTDETLKLAGIDNADRGAKQSTVATVLHHARGGDLTNLYRAAVNKLRDLSGDIALSANASANAITSAPGKAISLFFNNAGVKDSLRQIVRVRNDMQTASSDAVKRLNNSIGQKMKNSGIPTPEINQHLDQFFESPEFLARKYGENTPKLDISQLAPEEQGIVQTLIAANKMRNLALFKQGKINADEYAAFSDGMHAPRLYDFEKSGVGTKRGGNNLIDTTSTIKRKDLENIDDDTFEKLIDSPAQRMLIRLEMALRSNATNDALAAFEGTPIMQDVAPNASFSPLEGAKWGKYQGKFVYNPIKGQLGDSIVFNSKAGQTVGDLIDQYRNSPLGATDRFFKRTKTVFSPGTILGNITSNPIVFNPAAGVDPLTQLFGMAKSGRELANHNAGRTFDPTIYEAQKYGVFSSDTGKQLNGENNPELTLTKKNKGIGGKIAAAPGEFYGGIDDAAKLSIWKKLRARGIAPEEAARRVSLATQDYNNAGRLVRTLADMPVLGKPFARFAPELVRLVKNNALYNPVGMVAGVAGLALLQNKLSEMAGETPEQRAAREQAMGQTTIPGTAPLNKLLGGPDSNVSLNFPVGNAAVNAARALGLNFPIDDSGDPNMALIKNLVPFTIPTRENAQGDQVFAPEELFTSLFAGPIAQQVANRDFMGRKIDDPNQKTYYEGADGSEVNKYAGNADPGKAGLDRLRTLFMNYAPLANEADSLFNAIQGKEDYYGKTRTVPESIARVFGVKVESNDDAARQKRADTQDYFENDQKDVQTFLKDNPDLAATYFKLNNPTRTRPTDENDPGTKVSDLVSPEKWALINSDTTGRLYNFMKQQAISSHDKSVVDNQADPSKLVKPIDPVYMIPDDEAKYITQLRSRPTGDDTEAEEILKATTDWYPAYEKAYYDYLDKNTAYYNSQPQFAGAANTNPRVQAYSDVSAPVEQPAIIKEYYQIKAADPDKAKAVYAANKDVLSAAFDQYAVQRLDRINKLRAIEGYPAISLDTYKNSTFGFSATGGGYGSGGGGSKYVNTLGSLFNGTKLDALPTFTPAKAPNEANIFNQLMAGGGGGKAIAKLGAGNSGV